MKRTELLRKLNSENLENNIAIIIRHSAREKIEDEFGARDAPLTDEGRKMAVDFGKELPVEKYIRLFCSPVLRCIETVELIHEGFKKNGGRSDLLRDREFLPVSFAKKPKRILELMGKLGTHRFIREWYNGELEEGIMESPKKATIDQIDSIIGKMDDKGLDIHVAHSFNVILLFGLLYNLAEEEFRWPGYMDGVVIEMIDDKMKLYYDDREKIFGIDEYVDFL
ncbi:MAG: histidine phosphatase family protein [Promethearchaeota archaeon]